MRVIIDGNAGANDADEFKRGAPQTTVVGPFNVGAFLLSRLTFTTRVKTPIKIVTTAVHSAPGFRRGGTAREPIISISVATDAFFV